MKRWVLRVTVLTLFLLLLPLYVSNAIWLWQNSDVLIVNNWLLVVFYTALFLSFLFFLRYRQKAGMWKKIRNIYIAYVIALFTEMFGLPLTIYFLSFSAMSLPPAETSFIMEFEFLGQKMRFLLTSFVASLITLACIFIIAYSWRQIYRARGKLVTNGMYAFSRHPQYTAMIAIILIWTLAWPTLLTMFLGITLVIAYIKLAQIEERDLRKKFGKKYLTYAKKVPMFI